VDIPGIPAVPEFQTITTRMSDSDVKLLARLREGSSQAFEELIEAYQGPVFGFVYRLLEDPTEAPDVTQEVFLKVYRKLGDFRAECSLKTWIYRIAIHEASNRRRWFSRHRQRERPLDGERDENGFSWEQVQDQGDSPYDALRRREQKEMIAQGLRSMDERLRVALVLRDIEGLSYNEIADTLQISLGTVKSRILRGREALKTRLRREAPELAPDGCIFQTE
jgi:RNA polymerase sigma-70 factor (ECF subfamily)